MTPLAIGILRERSPRSLAGSLEALQRFREVRVCAQRGFEVRDGGRGPAGGARSSPRFSWASDGTEAAAVLRGLDRENESA